MTSLAFRPAVESDLALVHASWRASFRGSFAAGPIPLAMYHDVYREVIARILRRATVTVACHPAAAPGDADLYGWICTEPGVVHFVYVKERFRRRGIARGLFAAAGIDPAGEWTYTFKTEQASRLASKVRRARWNPLAVNEEEAA